MPGQVILEKHNGYKEVLNKAALDKSKEIAAAKMIYKKGIKGYPQALMGLGVSGSKRLSLKMANMVKM